MALHTSSYICDTFTTAKKVSLLPQTNASATQLVSLVLDLASSSLVKSLLLSCTRNALTVLDRVLVVQSLFPVGWASDEVHAKMIGELEAASFAICRLATATLSRGEVETINSTVTTYTLSQFSSVSSLLTSTLQISDDVSAFFPASLASAMNASADTPISVQTYSLNVDAVPALAINRLNPVTPMISVLPVLHDDVLPLLIKQDISVVFKVTSKVTTFA
jgi:hypothetical protein